MKLHKWESRWDVPSLNPACSQVEAYLRFSGASFTLYERNTPYTSPTGVLPYLELEDSGVEDDSPSDSLIDGTGAASAIISYLKKEKGLDLDTALSPVEAAELEAFTVLAETKLATASVYFTWVDYETYKKHTQAAYGDSLPAILNHYVPWRWRSSISNSMRGKSTPQVLEDVAIVYKAIAARLGTQKYFFGNRVTSLDALLFAHLSFHQRAPMAADHLRPMMDKFPELGQYVDGILKDHFSCPLPAPPSYASPSTSGASSEPSGGGGLDEMKETSWWGWFSGEDAKPKAKLTEKEQRFRRRSRAFMAFMGSALAAYALLGEVYIGQQPESEDEDYEDDEDDEE